MRSPLVTAVATSAIARTCVVRFAASWLTLSVRSRHVPAAPGTLRLAAELSFDADLARDRRDLVGERRQRVDHVVDRVGERRDLALALRRVSFCFRSPLATAVTTLAMPRTWFVRFDGHHVDVVGEVLPRAGDAAAPRPGRRASLPCRPRAPRA